MGEHDGVLVRTMPVNASARASRAMCSAHPGSGWVWARPRRRRSDHRRGARLRVLTGDGHGRSPIRGCANWPQLTTSNRFAVNNAHMATATSTKASWTWPC